MPNSGMGRLGRWCFERRWWVLLVWLVAVAGGVLSAGPVFDRLAEDNIPRHIESMVAYDVRAESNKSAGSVTAVVDRIDPADAAVRDGVARAAADLAAIPGVAKVDQPYDPALPAPRAEAMYAADRRALLISVTLGELELKPRDETVAKIERRLRELPGALPTGATVEVGGSLILNRDGRATVQQDIQRAEFISLPVTLLILLLVFGGLAAATLPVLAAAVSVAAAMALLLGFSTFTDVDQNGVTVVTLLGLGLSVDYGLLLVARYREELAAGYDPPVAVGRAWATAGRTILFSALTVAAALIGLLTFDVAGLSALGAAGVSIALVAMLAALTFTAALLGLFRKRIRPTKKAARDDDRGFFARLSGLVQRRPWTVALATGVALLAAGAPLLDGAIKLPRLEGIPRTIEAARVADTLADRFGRATRPAVTVVARIPADALETWVAGWADDPIVKRVYEVQRAGDVSSVDIEVKGDGQSDEARALVDRVRADRPPGGPSWVTGDAAILTDLLGLIRADLPLAVGITLFAMFVLLFAMTGSVVVPVKAILANLVSLGATLGVLTLVFHDGYGSGLLDTLTTGGLSPFVLVITFAFAFGLSMDYEVFLLGRVKEYVDHGMDTDTAVRRGLQHTGRVITSAALLMIVVFGCFAAARMGTIEQIGLGLTVAVLIDATVVRCLLVPATMTLLGRVNWWAPAPLRRLHERVGLRETVLPEPTPDREPVTAGHH